MLSRPGVLLVVNPTIPELRDELATPFYQNLFRFFAARERIGPFVVAARRTE